MLSVLIELLVTLFQVYYHLFLAILRTVLPQCIPKKVIKGKVALVTGAGHGLGALIASKIASLGAKVILWDVNEANNELTVGKIRSEGGTAFSYTIDLSDEQQIEKLARQLKHDVGSIDILINNAGIVVGKTIMETPISRMREVMLVNANAVMWTTKAFLADMLSHNDGHIVTIASIAGLFGGRKAADYCASKFAAVGFMESLAVELHGKGKDAIKTTTVCPYLISTGMFEGADSRFSWLLPLLAPEAVATAVVNAMLRDQDFVLMPKILWCFYVLKPWIPTKAFLAIANFIGLVTLMDGFKGRDA